MSSYDGATSLKENIQANSSTSGPYNRSYGSGTTLKENVQDDSSLTGPYYRSYAGGNIFREPTATNNTEEHSIGLAGSTVAVVVKDVSEQPLAGQTPTWLVYKNAITGADQAAPSVSDLGLGNYKFTLTGTAPVGLLDLGDGAIPRYRSYSAFSSVWSFPAFTQQGVPLPGLTPTWHSLKRVSNGTNYTPQPSISALGGGLYKTTFLSERLTGVIDLGETASPRFVDYDTHRPVILIPLSGEI